MELSYFLAQIMGVVVFAFGVAGLARPGAVRAAIRDYDHESFARLIIGCMAVGFGTALVLYHQVWEASWRGLVTLFGWTVLIKGGFYLFAPKQLIRFTRAAFGSESQIRLLFVGCIILGGYLAYKGFGF